MTRYELFVGGLNRAIETEHLVTAFKSYGKILDSKISVRSTRRKKCVNGFLAYASQEEADTAIEKMNGRKLRGCKLTVQYSRKPPKSAEKKKKTENGFNKNQNLSKFCESCGVERTRTNETKVEDGGGDHGGGFMANKNVSACGQPQSNEEKNIKIEEKDLNREEEDLQDYNREHAFELRRKAKREYANKNYEEALKLCNEAINYPDNPALYWDRAACYMVLNQYSKALNDARKSLKLDDKNVKVYEKLVKCYLIIGDMRAAERNLKIAIGLEPSNVVLLTLQNELTTLKNEFAAAEKLFTDKDYNQAQYHLNRAIEISPNCNEFQITKAAYLAFMKKYQESEAIISRILEIDRRNADAIYVRGVCLYYSGDLDKAISCFQNASKLDPGVVKIVEIYKRAKSLKEMKAKGDIAFKANRLVDAYEYYSTALNIDCTNDSINAKLYFNRATVSFKLGQLKKSIKDSTEALHLDGNYLKAILRRAESRVGLKQFAEGIKDYEMAYELQKSPDTEQRLKDAKWQLMQAHEETIQRFITIGEIRKAELQIDVALNIDPEDNRILRLLNDLRSLKTEFAEAKQYYAKKKYDEALSHLLKAMKFAENCVEMKLLNAECLASLKRCQEAEVIVNDILDVDNRNADAIYVRGICFYYVGDIDQAIWCLQKASKIVPGHSKVVELYKRATLLRKTKAEGNKAFKENRFDEAYEYYSTALEIDLSNNSINAKLYFNRATVSFKLGNPVDSIEDCTKALQLEEKYLKALLRRAECCMSLEQFAEAVRDYEMAYEIQSTPETEELLKEAKSLCEKQPERKDFHAILGVNQLATFAQIKKAYYKKALELHPDRHANVMLGQKRYLERKFKEMKKAFDFLAKKLQKK